MAETMGSQYVRSQLGQEVGLARAKKGAPRGQGSRVLGYGWRPGWGRGVGGNY